METTTREHRPAEHHQKPVAAQVEAIDPEHDIDAKRTFIWLSACLAFVVVTLLVLAQVFKFAVRGQQHQVIEALPAQELRQLRSDEDHVLKKVPPAGAADARSLGEIEGSIDATTNRIIEAYLAK
jgi:hypothetical protein